MMAEDGQVGLNNVEICTSLDDILSEDLEYPSCPECRINTGYLTELSSQSEKFRCAACGMEFGNPDEVYTSRNLPRPIRDDFAACIIAGEDPEDQAKFRDVPVSEVKYNLRAANTLLCHDWIRGEIKYTG